jgi:hypothetical protein
VNGKTQTSDLESIYRRITNNNVLLAVVHSQSYRSDAQELARKLLLERGLSEDAINQWRDPNAEVADPPWSRGGRTPLRILFLRPFDFPRSRKPTRRFVKHYLRHLGHTYTLSDTEIKPRRELPDILKFLLVVLGQSGWLVFFHPRSSFNVSYDEDIPRLMRFVSRKVSRNIVGIFTRDNLFRVSCAPETWKHAVQYLINSLDLIVIDLSNAGKGLEWELEELRFYGAMGKVVFVARYERITLAQLFLESCGLSEPNRELFDYGENGLSTRHEELVAALAAAASWSTTSHETLEPPPS